MGPKVGPFGWTPLRYGETLRWDPRAKAIRTVFIHIKEIVLYGSRTIVPEENPPDNFPPEDYPPIIAP